MTQQEHLERLHKLLHEKEEKIGDLMRLKVDLTNSVNYYAAQVHHLKNELKKQEAQILVGKLLEKNPKGFRNFGIDDRATNPI